MATLDFEIKDFVGEESTSTSDMLRNIMNKLNSYSRSAKADSLATSALPSNEEVSYIFESNLGELVGSQSYGETEELLKTYSKGEPLSQLDQERLETIQTLKALRYSSGLHQEMSRTGLLTVQQVCDIHSVLLSGLHHESGCIRSRDVFTHTKDGRHYYPSSVVVESLFYAVLDRHNDHMEKLENQFKEDVTFEKLVYIFKCAAWLMYHFVDTHPFPDGNGRTCRLLANYVLGLCNPFPITVCHSEHCDRTRYIDVIVRCREEPKKGLGELTALLVEATHCSWNRFGASCALQ